MALRGALEERKNDLKRSQQTPEYALRCGSRTQCYFQPVVQVQMFVSLIASAPLALFQVGVAVSLSRLSNPGVSLSERKLILREKATEI